MEGEREFSILLKSAGTVVSPFLFIF